MEKRILLVGCNTESAGRWVHRYPPCWAQTDWLESITHVPKALSERNDYLLIIIFSEDQSYLPHLPSIRARTNTPILIVTCCYDGSEKTAAIQAGADEYMQRPETPGEGLASAQALIRRFTALNRRDTPAIRMLTWGCIWIDLDYRKVWIGTEEIRLAHQDYTLFCLLVSSPERILTYEQLSQHMWGVGYALAANSLHSCIRRIRKKTRTGFRECLPYRKYPRCRLCSAALAPQQPCGALLREGCTAVCRIKLQAGGLGLV